MLLQKAIIDQNNVFIRLKKISVWKHQFTNLSIIYYISDKFSFQPTSMINTDQGLNIFVRLTSKLFGKCFTLEY